MFDFTKEVVINSENFATVSGSTGDKFRVHGGGDYHPKYIVAGRSYKTMFQEGSLAVLKINATDLVAALTSSDKHFTLNIELGLDRDARQDWATAVYAFKKPMVVDAFAASWGDAPAGSTANKYAYNLGKLLSAVLTDYKFVYVFTANDVIPEEFGVAAPSASEVLVVGSDYNVKVRKVTVAEYVCDARCEGSSEEPSVIFSGRPEDAPEYIVYTPNVVEFGTYNYLLHNLRMPTYENYRFTSPAAVEMPMAGAKYIQYTFLYCVPRPGLGGLSVAGQFNHSTTTHVFYVHESVASEFQNQLTALGINIVDVNLGAHKEGHAVEILPNAFATSSSVDGDMGETTIPEE